MSTSSPTSWLGRGCQTRSRRLPSDPVIITEMGFRQMSVLAFYALCGLRREQTRSSQHWKSIFLFRSFESSLEHRLHGLPVTDLVKEIRAPYAVTPDPSLICRSIQFKNTCGGILEDFHKHSTEDLCFMHLVQRQVCCG